MPTINEYKRRANELAIRATELINIAKDLEQMGLTEESDERMIEALDNINKANQYMIIVMALSQPTILN